MALSTYSDLQTSLAAWLDGSSFSGREADFIALCEAEMNARLASGVEAGRAIRPMMTSGAVTIDAQTVTPSAFDMTDVILPLSLMVTGLDRPWQVDYLDPKNLSDMRFSTECERDSVYSQIGDYPPRYYTMIGEDFQFLAPPEGSESFAATFTYYGKIPALSDAAPANWLLTGHPNAYLYGTLAQAEMFGWNDKGMGNWLALFDQAMNGVLSRYPVPANNAPLRSELGAFGRRGMDYNSFMAGI